MLNILKDFDYLEQYEYLKNRSFADELLFVAKEVDKRFFAKLTDEQLETLDHGFILFKKYFGEIVSYKDFRQNRITKNKQAYKLFKYISSNEEILKKYSKEEIKKYSEEIGKYKFPNEDLFFCISLNEDDFLLASTLNSWTSCINLIDGDYKRTVLGNLFNKGMFICYITNKQEKTFNTLKSYKMFFRSFGFVAEDDKLYTTLYYPTRTNFEITIGQYNLHCPIKETKSKYDFDLVMNKNNAFVFPYIDKGEIIKTKNGYSFKAGCNSGRFEAKVLVDDKLISFDDYFYFDQGGSKVKKHCDICFSESGIITTINFKNYCKNCFKEHKETCSRCGELKKCSIDDKNNFVCEDCLTEDDNICPVCKTIFPKTRFHTCRFCRSKYYDAYNKYLIYDKNKNNTYSYSKHKLLKENDIELADPNIKWDDVLGEYTLI